MISLYRRNCSPFTDGLVHLSFPTHPTHLENVQLKQIVLGLSYLHSRDIAHGALRSVSHDHPYIILTRSNRYAG